LEENFMLKRCLLALMLTGLLYAVTPRATAQDAGGYGQQQAEPAGAPPEHGHGRHFDPEKRSEMMAKHLNLNADQQTKVKDILTSEQSQMQKLHGDSSMSQDDRRSKMMDLHKASNDQIRALLNPDQQRKFDEMQSKHEQGQGHHHGQAPGAAAPDSQQK
jgi:periplasmic protein CpxP/Spy